MAHRHQARLLQPLERLAHRAAIDAERFAEHALGGQRRSRRHRPADDLVAQLLEHGVGQRLLADRLERAACDGSSHVDHLIVNWYDNLVTRITRNVGPHRFGGAPPSRRADERGGTRAQKVPSGVRAHSVAPVAAPSVVAASPDRNRHAELELLDLARAVRQRSAGPLRADRRPRALSRLYRLMRGTAARRGRYRRRRASSTRTPIVFALETMLDPFVTGPLVRALGIADEPARRPPCWCSFVLLGDFRVYLLLFGLLAIARGRALERRRCGAPRLDAARSGGRLHAQRARCTRRCRRLPIPNRSGSSTSRCSPPSRCVLRARLVAARVAAGAARRCARICAQSLAYVAAVLRRSGRWRTADPDRRSRRRLAAAHRAQPALLRVLGPVRVLRVLLAPVRSRPARRPRRRGSLGARGRRRARGSPTTPLGLCARRLGIEDRLRIGADVEQPRLPARRGGRVGTQPSRIEVSNSPA